MSPLDLLSQRFAAVAGPLAVLGAVVSASTSGFSVLGTAVRVLATTLAPILLPVVVAVATGLVTLADELDPLIQEALPRWTAFIFDKLIPAFAFLADVVAGTVGVFVWMGEAVGDAIGAIGDFVSWIGEKIEPDSDTGKAATGIAALLAGRGGEGVKKLGEVGDETGKVALGSPFAAALEKVRRDPEGVGKGELADDAAGGKGEKGTRGSALMDVLRSLRLSTMPRAQISGLSEAHRGAQMAALNADPLEAKMLRKLDETLTVMERTAVGVEKLAATKPDFKVAPRGDWGGDF